MEILDSVYYGNSVRDYIIAAGIIVGGILLVNIFKRIILTRLKKWSERTETTGDDFVVSSLERFGLPAISCVVMYWGVNYLELSKKFDKVMDVAVAVAVAFFSIRFVAAVLPISLESYVRKQDHGEDKIRQLKGAMLLINLFVWVIGAVFLFDNLGYNVTTIVTGLGIGGIAVALAAQNILGDLFNYFVIFFDRPFEMGDFIVVDDKMGTVDYIGIKTTRLKSLTGEQLIFANSDLTTSRIHNFKRMDKRRIVFTINVVYQTSVEKLRRIPSIIRTAIESHKDITFDRCHFVAFAESSLKFETVYFVMNADYNIFANIQQEVNLYIVREFAKEEIEFAYPTQTVYAGKETIQDIKSIKE